MNKTLELLKRMVEELNPHIQDNYGRDSCFFCGEDWEKGERHDSDCIWILAKELIGVEEDENQQQENSGMEIPDR